MLIRKINAGLGLFINFLLLDHAIFYSVWMMSGGTIEKSAAFMPWVLMGLTIVHALLGMELAISGIMESAERKCKLYHKLNAATMIQRISGILMLLLIGLHIAGATKHFQPKMLHAVVHPLFFVTVLTHIALSSGKALITLGIGNAKVIKIVDGIVKVICGLTLIICMTGLYLYLFREVAE